MKQVSSGTEAQPRRPGRPRSFDEVAAVEQAMQVFWRKGYDATSISDLTAAMGINPPSLYAAFGNKEGLFARVLDCYASGPAAYVIAALSAASAREVAERRLLGAVRMMCDKAHAPGCLAVQAAARAGEATGDIAQTLFAFCEGAHRLYVERFRRAKADGDLSQDSDPVALARYLTTVTHGLSLQAASGAPRAELRKVARMALQHFERA